MFIKYFTLALVRLQTYMKSNKLIFILFFGGSVIVSIALIFFYGNSLQYKEKTSNNSIQYRTFDVSFIQNYTVTSKDLNQLLKNDNNFQDALLMYKTDIFLDEKNPNSNFTIAAFINNNDDIYKYSGKVSFDKKEFERDVAIVPIAFGDIKTIDLVSEEFTVVGRTTNFMENIVFIPINSYLSHNFPTTDISYISKCIPTPNENNEILRKLSNVFSSSNIYDPYENIQKDKDKTTESVVTVSLIYVVSFISFLFLFKYMVDQNSYENIIYSFVGARKGSVVFITIVEIFVLSASAAIVGCLIHMLFYNGLFSKINIFENLTYSIIDYVICCILIILLSLISVLPFIKSYRRNSLVNLRIRYNS